MTKNQCSRRCKTEHDCMFKPQALQVLISCKMTNLYYFITNSYIICTNINLYRIYKGFRNVSSSTTESVFNAQLFK